MKKVAIIEDHTAVRDMIAQIVRTMDDWEIVAECGDGRTALEECIQTRPDFIILDIMLPGLNGAEILRRLAEIDHTLLQHDKELSDLWDRLQLLLSPPDDSDDETPQPQIGFHVREKTARYTVKRRLKR